MFPIFITPSFTTGPDGVGFAVGAVGALMADLSIDTGLISGVSGTTTAAGEGIMGAIMTAAGAAGGTTITVGVEGAAGVTAAVTTGGVGCITGVGGNAGVSSGVIGAGDDTGVGGTFVGVGGAATSTTASSFLTDLGEGDLDRGAFSIVTLLG